MARRLGTGRVGVQTWRLPLTRRQRAARAVLGRRTPGTSVDDSVAKEEATSCRRVNVVAVTTTSEPHFVEPEVNDGTHTHTRTQRVACGRALGIVCR